MNEAKQTTVQTLVMTALMMGLIMVATFIVRVPVPATQGYIHFGDCMIFIAIMILGWKYGAIAAAFGSALADIIGGYAFYAPITFVVKGLMAIVAGLFIAWAHKKWSEKRFVPSLIGMVLGGLVMVAGYFTAEAIMYGSLITPLAGVAMNIVQFAVGITLAVAISVALERTPLKKMFTYDILNG